MKTAEIRWSVFKNYYREPEGGDMFTDGWCILYGTEAEAIEAMNKQLTGYDKSWFDPAGNDYAGYDAVLYVDRVTL
jgi:hypothetical protein